MRKVNGRIRVRMLLNISMILVLFLVAALSQAAETTKQGDVPVDGISLHYYEAGQGQPLVLLHQFGWSGKVWEPFVPALAAHHRVIVVDLPGHGGSTGWDERHMDYPRNAQRILKFLDTIGVKDYDIIGASSGSITALEMAVSQPKRVHRMILVASTPRITEDTRKWVADNACAPDTEEGIKEELVYQTHGREQVLGLDRMFCNEKDNPFDITDTQLRTVQAETLMIHGDHDPIFPLSAAMGIYGALPNAYLWVQPNAKHVFIFKPDYQQLFVNNALAFLDGQWAPKH